MVRAIDNKHASPELPILILGKKTSTKKKDQGEDDQERQVVQVESLENIKDYFQSNDAAGLIITGDRQDIRHDDISDILHILGPSRFLLFRPSDEVMDRFIRSLLTSNEKADTKSYRDDYDELRGRISTLETKNASLEATIRTLVAALSQCDPWPEAYAGDENAWDLIMQNVPVADQDQAEFDQSYDENSGEEEEFEEG
ncbi:hypothetical protein [Methanospirillum lacunae]|uniref:hypothetical protein n=1 Tax=Methanospirillum lacunae TaxID=668570 RepID=UPI000D70132F